MQAWDWAQWASLEPLFAVLRAWDPILNFGRKNFFSHFYQLKCSSQSFFFQNFVKNVKNFFFGPNFKFEKTLVKQQKMVQKIPIEPNPNPANL